MFRWFKPKKELDNKSMHISVMYLYTARTKLEDRLTEYELEGNKDTFTTTHDIKCIDNAIEYLTGEESIK